MAVVAVMWRAREFAQPSQRRRDDCYALWLLCFIAAATTAYSNAQRRAAPPARRNLLDSYATGHSSRRATKKKTPRLGDVEGPSLETRVGSLMLRRLAEIRCCPFLPRASLQIGTHSPPPWSIDISALC